MTRSLCQEVTKNWHSIPSNRTTACSGSNVSVDLGIVSLTLGNSPLPLAHRLVCHTQHLRKLLLRHFHRFPACCHKSAYFFTVHANTASLWRTARRTQKLCAAARLLQLTTYPASRTIHSLWKPCLRSVDTPLPPRVCRQRICEKQACTFKNQSRQKIFPSGRSSLLSCRRAAPQPQR